MTALAAARIIGGNCPHRVKDDFYSTPDDVTESLLKVWQPADDVWEPACGDGAMVRILERHGHKVVGTDLVDRGLGGGIDFLMEWQLLAPTIITNPPFNLAAQFIEHAHRIGCDQLALFLKGTYWHAAKRLPLFERHPPAVIMPLTWRPDFTGGGHHSAAGFRMPRA